MLKTGGRRWRGWVGSLKRSGLPKRRLRQITLVLSSRADTLCPGTGRQPVGMVKGGDVGTDRGRGRAAQRTQFECKVGGLGHPVGAQLQEQAA